MALASTLRYSYIKHSLRTKLNILLTSVGRRGYLVRYFREALQGQGRVIVTNSVPFTAGTEAADVFELVPPSHSPGYPELILDLCERHRIGLICSLHDLDGYVLAGLNPKFREMKIYSTLPEPEWARRCLDKFECGNILRRMGFDVPWSSLSLDEARRAIDEGVISFPLLLKARFGFGSLGVRICANFEELEQHFEEAKSNINASVLSEFLRHEDGFINDAQSKRETAISNPSAGLLIQEFFEGPEFCVGLVNDFQGQYAGHFVCKVLEMRAGESDSAISVGADAIGAVPTKLSKMTRHHGIWGLDIISVRNRHILIDINPRFTGDYPFHHLAGASVPAALITWARGGRAEQSWLQAHAGVRGFKDLVPRRTNP